MIVDTSALLAYVDAHERAHSGVAAVIDASDEPLVLAPFVLAELDYLLLSGMARQRSMPCCASSQGAPGSLPTSA